MLSVGIAVGLAFFALPSHPRPISPAVQQAQAVCLECHQVPTLWSTDPLTGREYRLGLDVPAWEKSSHAAMRCEACHEYGYGKTVPHRSSRRRDAFACLQCHRDDDALAEWEMVDRRVAVEMSVHVDKVEVPFDCHRCHDPHVFRRLPDNARAQERIDYANDICLGCHGQQGGHRPFDKAPRVSETHGFLPRTDMHLTRTACVGCHGEEDRLWHSIMPAENAVADCQKCHAQDTPLLHQFYGNRHTVEGPTGIAQGFANAAVFDDAYVIGATRALGLERLSQGAFALVLLGIGAHAFARAASSKRPRR